MNTATAPSLCWLSPEGLQNMGDAAINAPSMKRLGRWRDEKATHAAISAGALWSFRTCGQCGNYEPMFGACPYIGKTMRGASCDFWVEADDEVAASPDQCA